MKTKLFVASLLSIALLTGCSTTRLTPAQVAGGLGQIAKLGSAVDVANNTNHAAAWLAGATAAEDLAGTSNPSPDALQQALLASGIAELQGPEALLVVSTLVDSYNLYLRSMMPTNVTENAWATELLTAGAKGVREGVPLGLSMAASRPPKVPKVPKTVNPTPESLLKP